MKRTVIVLSLFASSFLIGTNSCEAKLYLQILNHSKYDAATAKCIPSKHGWGKLIRIFSSNTLPKNSSSSHYLTKEVSLNINEGSDLVFLSVTPNGTNELAVNKIVKVNKMTISKKIARYSLGINSEIAIPEQLAKVEEDSKDRVKISMKFSHPDKK